MRSRKSNCGPDSSRYTGRFAPSPSGPLHFGSLLTAVASWLDARAHQGRWLLRMEDLDPEREPPGTDRIILQQLQDFGLHWDEEVLYQSTRLSQYQQALAQLQEQHLLYPCDCSRQRLKSLGSIYDGHCRERPDPPARDFALRLRTRELTIEFDDRIQGPQRHALASETGDFIVCRRDNHFAYQLAVVVDDAWQQITDVVRGWDLLESTPRQIYLQSLLGYPRVTYAHIPVVVNAEGQKLSKQHYATPIKAADRQNQLHDALQFLGLQPPATLRRESVAKQLQWALPRWHIQTVPQLANIPATPLPSG